MIFGFYVAWRFDWCMICAILEKFCLSSPEFGRGRRSETVASASSYFRVCAELFAMYAPACLFDWFCFLWLCHVCVPNHLMKRIVSFCLRVCWLTAECALACVFVWLIFVWLAMRTVWLMMWHADCIKWGCAFWCLNMIRWLLCARLIQWSWYFLVYFKLIHFPPFLFIIPFILFILENA